MKFKSLTTILHLTPHVGGGVGTVLYDLVLGLKDNDYFHIHKIACLDKCHEFSRKRFQRLNVAFQEGLAYENHSLIKKLIESADLVILHYWNHPLLANLLINKDIGEARFLVWCHGSGLNEPSVIPSYLIDLSDKLLFSSRISYLAPNLKPFIENSDKKFQAIRSARNLTDFISIGQNRNSKDSRKSLLYIGTISYDKVHLDFLKIIVELALLGFDITIVGSNEHNDFQEHIPKDLKNKIVFTGEVFDVKPFYKKADIFIYPLKANHYGTGEQVLQEAMACGLPVVAFDNPSERDLIDENYDGFLVSNYKDFVRKVLYISCNLAKYLDMSHACITKAKTQFSVAVVANTFQELINKTLRKHKKKYISKLVYNDQDLIMKAMLYSSFHYPDYFFSIQNNSLKFNKIKLYDYINTDSFNKNFDSWTSSSKGTPLHYLKFFPSSSLVKDFVDHISLRNDKFINEK